jgi:hypothetical protein
LPHAEGQELEDATHDFVKCAKDLLVVINPNLKKNSKEKMKEKNSLKVVALVHASV